MSQKITKLDADHSTQAVSFELNGAVPRNKQQEEDGSPQTKSL